MALSKTTRYSRHTFGDNGAMGNKQVVSVSFAATDLGKPANASTTGLLAATALSDAGTTTLTPTTQPGVPRAVTITLGGTAADINGGTAVVSGTNSEGKAITENFTITEDTAETLTGAKAFASVTSVAFPQMDGPAATAAIGTSNKFGTGYRTPAGSVVKIMTRTAAGVVALEDASASAKSTSAPESNTVTPTTTPDGTVNMRAYVLNYNWHVDPLNDNPDYGM